MKWILVVSLLLGGCQTVEYVNIPKTDIAYPDPIVEQNINWQVKEIDGEIMTLLTLEDNQKLRIMLADILRYTRDMRSMVCYYKDTSDEYCNKLKDGE